MQVWVLFESRGGSPGFFCSVFFFQLFMSYATPFHTSCVKDVRGLQSFVLTHSEESDSVLFHPLFAITNTFNVCIFEHPLFAITNMFNVCIFETKFSHFFRGEGLGVYTVHHCHRKLRVNIKQGTQSGANT